MEVIAGFILASGAGIALAIVLSASARVRNAIYPSILFFQLIPKIALAPLFILWFGIGPTSRLAYIIFISFFPVVLASVTGFLSTPPEMLRLCRACGARQIDVFLRVRFPYALPMIFSGLKISVTFAIVGVVVGEFISAQAGLGYLILFASSQADTPLAMAAISVLCVIGLALYGVVVLAESMILRRIGEPKQ
jgi:NitT/TauT family transport system permease protein